MGVVLLDAVDSTQDEIHRIAADGAPAGTSIMARRQGRGRGSRGREWDSPEGGCWLSVLWRGAPADAQLLAIRAGLAVAGVLDGVLASAPRPRLKWPNDVLLDGRKVGGILCEGRWQGRQGWVAIGVGLNVQNTPPAGARFPAAALGEWDPGLDPVALGGMIAPLLPRLPDRNFLDDTELARWQERDWLAGRTLTGPVRGVVEGITRQGRLVISAPGGTRHELVAGDALEL